MSCDNVITVQDLETDKKHSTFYREVITGKAGGTGADIDSATNAVTGQTQSTLPKVLSNVGFSPAGFDFTTGGTLTERDKAIFYQPDGNWYSWGGTLPKVVPPASSPLSTGGIADNAWNVSTSAFMYRDWEGFTAELLAQAGIVDDGQPDELGNSQRVDAMRKIFSNVGTVADVAAGKFKVGDTICVKDRAGGVFSVVLGGSPNGFDIINAGNGNTAELKLEGKVEILSLGVNGDGVTDDTAVLQRALELSYQHQMSFVGAPISCRTTSTIYIGNYPDATEYVSIDFAGMTILPDDSVLITVDSGKFVSGAWVTAWDDPIETYMSFFADFKNLKVLGSSDDAKSGRIGIRLKDWHYQCELSHLGVKNFDTGFSVKHVFGLAFDQCSLFNSNSANKTGQGFLLRDNVNLVRLSRCLATNVEIGYNVFGGVSGVVFDNCSFEGQTTGAQFHDAVYAVEVCNCYIENIIDTCFEFESQILSATFRNNYINLSTTASANAYLFDYVELPNNNINFDSTNTILSSSGNFLPDDRYIKNMNLHTTYGYNRLNLQRKVSELTNISDLLINNDNFPLNMEISQVKETEGLKANVVNRYAKGNYSGRYSNGRDNPNGNGFEWVNNNNNITELRTRMTPSTSARIYLSLRVTGGTLALIRGELIGDCNVNGNMDFYEYTATGLSKTSKVTVALVGGFYHLYYTHNATVTAVAGEVRLL